MSILAKTSFLAAAMTFALSGTAFAETGKGYELEGALETPLFNYDKKVTENGNQVAITSTYTDSAGKPLVIETSEFTKEGERWRVKSYRISQKQLGAEGVVEVSNGKTNFTYTKDGKTKTSDEKASDELIIGPGIANYIQSNWAKITGGKTVKGRLAVADRLETVGFDYFKEGEEEIRGEKAVVVKMKPSSFIIAAIVNPLRFYFTSDGKRLIQIRGRTQVKRQDGSKYKDLDANLVLDK